MWVCLHDSSNLVTTVQVVSRVIFFQSLPHCNSQKRPVFYSIVVIYLFYFIKNSGYDYSFNGRLVIQGKPNN